MDSKPLVDSTASASVEKNKAPTNTDSKAPVTVRDFDLNKFSDEETQLYQDEGLNQVVRLMLKAYLPKFYVYLHHQCQYLQCSHLNLCLLKTFDDFAYSLNIKK